MLGRDHVAIAVLREACAEPVAGLGRFSVAEVVRNDDVVSRGIERLARAKQFLGELGPQKLFAANPSCRAGSGRRFAPRLARRARACPSVR